MKTFKIQVFKIRIEISFGKESGFVSAIENDRLIAETYEKYQSVISASEYEERINDELRAKELNEWSDSIWKNLV